MKLLSIPITAPIILISCVSPYTRIEQAYYPERFKRGKRLTAAEAAKRSLGLNPKDEAARARH